ncbi:MAG: transposase [Candidatus Competibacteraceae bacterium]|nr:MAG: transposase [Candidatus Competibacteraceae bacterium]
MNRFLTIFGPRMIACLFADREFIGIQWFGYLIENQIKFVIRIKKNTQKKIIRNAGRSKRFSFA